MWKIKLSKKRVLRRRVGDNDKKNPPANVDVILASLLLLLTYNLKSILPDINQQ